MAKSTGCEVFVLDRPAYWRPIAEQPPLRWVDEKHPAIFLNGCLHFLCRDGGIVTFSFSINDETFGSLPPPSGFKDAASIMTELDRCLCLCYGEPDSEDLYHVCVLRDYNQWETLCCIDRTAWLNLSAHCWTRSGWPH